MKTVKYFVITFLFAASGAFLGMSLTTEAYALVEAETSCEFCNYGSGCSPISLQNTCSGNPCSNNTGAKCKVIQN